MKPLNDALAIIRGHQKGDLPVQTVTLARDLGLRVFKVPNWDDELSGMIKKNPENEGGFDIFVNADHPRKRRRFTIAHEIAHAVLHPHLIGDGVADDALYRSGLSNAVEAQANRLAADILMPRDRLSELLSSGITSIATLASKFDVSEQAMSIRLGVPQGAPEVVAPVPA
jgi:Zn-dependent peptidase ImmA (M78 family)